ncbi:MAG: C40 family peptidase [Chitinophagaceae bacterium]
METKNDYAICCIPVSPMRLEPAHRSEMVSQQLFGEPCLIIERGKDHWIKIKGRYDGYEGWCQDGHVTKIDEDQYLGDGYELTVDWINEIEYNGNKMIIPFGSALPPLNNGKTRWTNNVIQFNGARWNFDVITHNEDTVRDVAFRFLNTSYLWGGKSIFGIDCSAFTQTVYKFLQVPLPRDAYQQADVGEALGFLQEARCGDLAFFDNEDGRITHVGILLNDHEIIHSSVKVRVDKIDNLGIINQDTFERTHKLRIIKRYF